MKTIKIIVLITTIGIGFNACSEDNQLSQVDLNFTLTYDGSPLVGFSDFTYPLGYEVFFSKYSLFLSDITLTSSDGNHQLSDVEFIDLLTGVDTEDKARSGSTLQYLNVPSKTYSGISFNIGVPETVNLTAPADYDSTSPLSNNGEYWVGWTSYIFHKIEGKMDADNDGDPEAGIALHIGSDDAFRQISISQSLDISDDQETILINFDLKEILEINGVFFDFQDTPQIHHLGVLPKALPILDNTLPSVRIE